MADTEGTAGKFVLIVGPVGVTRGDESICWHFAGRLREPYASGSMGWRGVAKPMLRFHAPGRSLKARWSSIRPKEFGALCAILDGDWSISRSLVNGSKRVENPTGRLTDVLNAMLHEDDIAEMTRLVLAA